MIKLNKQSTNFLILFFFHLLIKLNEIYSRTSKTYLILIRNIKQSAYNKLEPKLQCLNTLQFPKYIIKSI